MDTEERLYFAGLPLVSLLCALISQTLCSELTFSWQLIQSPVTTPLGLIMLKTTSEELACPREDLSVARKEELRKLLLDQVQTVLGLLTGEWLGGARRQSSACRRLNAALELRGLEL